MQINGSRSEGSGAGPKILLGLAVVLLMVTGCGQGTGGRLAVSGQVTLRGVPLEKGTIEFVSQDASRQTGAGITNGQFSVPAAKGLLPGKYTVRITAVQESSGPPSGPPGPEAVKHESKDLIPPEYNAKSTLTADVKSEANNRFTFELK